MPAIRRLVFAVGAAGAVLVSAAWAFQEASSVAPVTQAASSTAAAVTPPGKASSQPLGALALVGLGCAAIALSVRSRKAREESRASDRAEPNVA